MPWEFLYILVIFKTLNQLLDKRMCNELPHISLNSGFILAIFPGNILAKRSFDRCTVCCRFNLSKRKIACV